MQSSTAAYLVDILTSNRRVNLERSFYSYLKWRTGYNETTRNSVTTRHKCMETSKWARPWACHPHKLPRCLTSR